MSLKKWSKYELERQRLHGPDRFHTLIAHRIDAVIQIGGRVAVRHDELQALAQARADFVLVKRALARPDRGAHHQRCQAWGIPDVDRVTACMIAKRSQLSPECRRFFRNDPEPSAAAAPVRAGQPVNIKPAATTAKKSKAKKTQTP